MITNARSRLGGEPAARAPSEAEIAASADAVQGLKLVEARLARCSQGERDAFWEAVRRCFASAATDAATAA
ncbi:hypothetical protein [Methylobacterium trifolii]|nr:hypothetical protein [Methylobacterium trifolii]